MTDRNSMAHSIEARVPYVDSRIVEFAFQLPDSYKIGGGKRKRILRLIAEHYLPQAIVSRIDRIGFGAPIEQWLTNDFHAELTRLPDNGVFSRSDLVDPSLLRQYIKRFLTGGHRDSGTIWRLYAVDTWARVYCVSGI
jgi:asparagine synthase (glutamine-hydrolysing)